MSLTYWAFEVNAPHDRLVAWMSSFAARHGERFFATDAMTHSREDIFWQLTTGHTPQWSRAFAPQRCIPELVIALSRELETKVVSICEQENVGMNCFCVVERGEIRTLHSDCDDEVEEVAVDRRWVERYWASGLVRVPRGAGPEDYDGYLYPAFIHVACELDMKWAWGAALEDWTTTHCMTGARLANLTRRWRPYFPGAERVTERRS